MTWSIGALVLGVLAYGFAGARLSAGAQAAGGALRSAAWWMGTALQGAGFAFTLAARQALPLLIVQACVVGGLAVTAIIQHLAGVRRVGGRDWLAILAVTAGIAALAATTVPGPAVPVTTTHLLVIGALVAACLAAYAVPLPAAVSGFVAGTGFATSAIAARLLVADPAHPPWRPWDWPPSSWALAVLLAGGLVLGQVHLTRGLARAHAVGVLGANYLMSTLVPAVVGVLLLAEQPRAGTAWLVAVGLVLALAGAFALIRGEEETAGGPGSDGSSPLPPKPSA